jgi:15-cis-phytoene desaturase
MTERKKVIILGGGVGGMSAAQELLERSGEGVAFDVHVYEHKLRLPGGKARSIPVPSSGTQGRGDLPGEHGFRFFPGFYRHLPDSMRRIPYGEGKSVADNLVTVDKVELALFDKPPIVGPARFPSHLKDLSLLLHDFFLVKDLGLDPGEFEFFAARLWQILTSCADRRLGEYEKITWWDYLRASEHSVAFQNLLVAGLSRSLLANDPRRASARTVGDTNGHLFVDIAEPGVGADRVLNGPTSRVWLQPWLEYLERLGASRSDGPRFSYHFEARAQAILCSGGRVAGVRIVEAGLQSQVSGDFYVFALPVERMARLLEQSRTANGQDPASLDPTLAGIFELSRNVGWMNGIQYFLLQDVPIVRGHCLYVDSPWALTSISEAQFWSELDLTTTGDGTVHGVLSVCVSDWDAPGILYDLPAKQCTREQIAHEVWAQLKRSLNVGGAAVLEDANIHSWFLDPDLEDDPSKRYVIDADTEPLLINCANTWHLRPEAFTAIPNLYLAADYVRTNTDVACMEAANEAARRAVNCILAASGSRAHFCEIWKLHEAEVLAPLRMRDQQRYDLGLPWSNPL